MNSPSLTQRLVRMVLRSPSSRAFYDQELARPNASLQNWLHGYVYARWPYAYIGTATGRHPVVRALRSLLKVSGETSQPPAGAARTTPRKQAFAHGYHGKVVPLEQASRLVSVQRDIDLGDLEKIIPYSAARNIVLRNPRHIAVLECPCRATSSNPCLPLDVCLIIGEPFAGFIVEHHPHKARWITPAEAQEILRAEHRRGHVHHAFFKDAMLGRFYAICNCCSCCCGAMQGHRNGVPMLACSGYVCVLDASQCTNCGLCIRHCQFFALRRENGQTVLHQDQCMGCGVCADICPSNALDLVRDPARGEPLDIQELAQRQCNVSGP